jgi:hypothetical protein
VTRGDLSTVERGFLVAAVRALGPAAVPFLRQHSEALARAAQPLAADPSAMAREIARLDASPPEGIERVHPTWWQRPPTSSHPAARTYLERAALAHLVPMPAPPFWSASPALGALEGLPSEALAQLLAALGRRRVALAFSEAPREALAQLCARLGEPAASEVLAEVKAVRPSHEEARAAQRALFKLTVDARDARSLLLSAGARWLGPALAAQGGDLLRRVAQRLPQRLGTALLAEAGAAATAADHDYCLRAIAELAR